MTNKKVFIKRENMRVYFSFQRQYLFLETHSFLEIVLGLNVRPL